MKITIFTLIAIVLMSCNHSQNKKTLDYSVLTGNVKVEGDSTLYFNADKFNRSANHVIQGHSNGKFSDTLRNIKWNTTYSIRFKDADIWKEVRFYLTQGDATSITYNKESGEFVFIGKNAPINNYLLEKDDITQKVMKEGKNSLFKLDEPNFVSELKKLYDSYRLILEATKDISADFKSQEIEDLTYEYMSWIGEYRIFHIYASENQHFNVSDSFYNDFNKVDFDDYGKYQNNSTYRELVLIRLRELRSMRIKELKNNNEDFSMVDLWFDLIEEEVKGDSIQEALLTSALFEVLNGNILSVDETHELYNNVSPLIQSKSNKDRIKQLYTDVKKLWAGSPSPMFSGYESYDGTIVSLEDFKGSYVYIDVWATWCGPCKIQIPFLETLEKDYHGKNIKFISISVDKDADIKKWKKMIVEKEMTGIQLIADKQLKSTFIRDYNISGIPRFILIDPEGNIINSNAPRPSSDEIRTIFDGLNI